MTTPQDKLAIENFRKYLQIPSFSTSNYEPCVEFLKEQAASLDLKCKVVYLKPNRPVVIMKWPGINPDLPSICLNSHMDVVPVEEDKWTHPPFAADIDADGRIYARGTQDMKCVGSQYLEAVRRLKAEGARLTRNVVLTFVPDEELGGQEGMKLFVQTREFRKLNIGCALDEGVASNTPHTYTIFYAEKHKWSVRFHVTGNVGHASVNMANTAAEKLARLLARIYEFRTAELARANGNPSSSQVTAINVTMIQGGQQENVIPSEYVVTTDIRLPPNVDIEQWKATLETWCQDAGEGVSYEESVCEILDKPTTMDSTNPYYEALMKTFTKMRYTPRPIVCFAMTDARYMRNKGIPVFGISPMTGPPLPHMHDEYIDTKDFLNGIEFYCKLLLNLGYVPEYN